MNLETIFYLVTIFTSLVGGMRLIITAYNNKTIFYRKKLHDKWTNEGDILNYKNTHYIDLDININIESGKICGVVDIRNLSTDDTLVNVSINGRLKYKKAHLKLSNIISYGRYIEYGEVILKIGKYGDELLWLRKKGDSNYLPDKVYLWKLNS